MFLDTLSRVRTSYAKAVRSGLRPVLVLNCACAVIFWLALLEPSFLPWMKFVAVALALSGAGWVTVLARRENAVQALRQRAEEQRWAAELRAVRVSADKAKSDFLAVISHEIRTPMNSIVGFADLLAGGQLGREQRECVNAIITGSGQLLGLIDHMLEYSRLESGQVEFLHEPVALRACIEDVLDTVRVGAAAGVDLTCEIDSGVPAVVSTDPHRLDQVLLQLVGNAAKFTERGEVTVQVRLGTPQSADGPLALEFRVRDTGIGLRDDALARLFKPFSQADSTSTRRYGGLGLGLAIAKRVVELMGGRMGAAARVQGGAEFFFTLPVAPVEATAGEAVPMTESFFGEANAAPSLSQFAFCRTVSLSGN